MQLFMDDEQLTSKQDRRMLELLEEAALNDYPNPDRIGCPGTDFLKRLATDRRSISLSDPALDHVASCSPCFREFAGYRDRAKRAKVTRRVAIATGAAFVVAGGTAGFRVVTGKAKQTPATEESYEDRDFDMFNDGPERGAADGQSASPDLPRKRLNLHLTLPFASPEGDYEVQVMGPNGATGVKASGTAHIVKGKTLLRIRLDLTKLQPNTYTLAIRRIPYDWTSKPVRIE
jgi:hypothetical protein